MLLHDGPAKEERLCVWVNVRLKCLTDPPAAIASDSKLLVIFFFILSHSLRFWVRTCKLYYILFEMMSFARIEHLSRGTNLTLLCIPESSYFLL